MMNKIYKFTYVFILLVSFLGIESCTYLKKADSGIRKVFGTANKFKRQQKLYTKRLGLDDKGGNASQDGESEEGKMVRNPLQQKNMINQCSL